MTNDLARLIDIVDENAKVITDMTSLAKDVLAKNPQALDAPIIRDMIKANLGESVYDKIRKTYLGFIGT